MHVVFRLLFWLTLAGTALSLVAPALVPAAAWNEAQPVALLGLLMTLVFAWASARALPSSLAGDPYAAAKRRRSSGIAYAVIMMVVLGPISLIALNEAQQDVRGAEYDSAEESRRAQEYGYASPYSNAADDLREAEAGEITSFAGLGVVGLAFIGLLVAASRRLPQPQAQAPMFPTSGPPYQAIVMQPYPQHYAHQQGPVWNENTFG